MTPRETIDRAYANIPREVSSPTAIFEWVLPIRGIRYYLLKLKRYLTR